MIINLQSVIRLSIKSVLLVWLMSVSVWLFAQTFPNGNTLSNEESNVIVLAQNSDNKSPAKTKKVVEKNLWHYISNRYRLPGYKHRYLKGHRDWFKKNPDYLTRVTKRAKPYLHLIVKEIERAGMPLDFALLPIVESAFYPFSYSVGSASGLWQFTPNTGKLYGLKQDWWQDERRHVLSSTRAALRYLKRLYYAFNKDWLLAIAAYNSGPGRVERAINRNKAAGKKTDFWHLRLPAETRGYVPRLLAVAQLIKYPEKYNQVITFVENKPVLKAVKLRAQTDLALVAQLTGLSLEDIYTYNPGLNRWATPPGRGFELLLPIEIVDDFIPKLSAYPNEKRIKWLRHKVVVGDSLNSIAKQYKTNLSALKQANDLNGHLIKVGDYLIIPVPQQQKSYYALSEEERQQQRFNIEREGKKIIYTVKKGDSLWLIANKNGVEVHHLIKWNKISPRDPLQIDQKLVLWQPLSQQKKQPDFSKLMQNSTRVERKITYKVRPGDNLSVIAKRFNVSVGQLKKWNIAIKPNNIIQPKQKLTIYVDVTNLHD